MISKKVQVHPWLGLKFYPETNFQIKFYYLRITYVTIQVLWEKFRLAMNSLHISEKYWKLIWNRQGGAFKVAPVKKPRWCEFRMHYPIISV